MDGLPTWAQKVNHPSMAGYAAWLASRAEKQDARSIFIDWAWRHLPEQKVAALAVVVDRLPVPEVERWTHGGVVEAYARIGVKPESL